MSERICSCLSCALFPSLLRRVVGCSTIVLSSTPRKGSAVCVTVPNGKRCLITRGINDCSPLRRMCYNRSCYVLRCLRSIIGVVLYSNVCMFRHESCCVSSRLCCTMSVAMFHRVYVTQRELLCSTVSMLHHVS